jgi:hypothetical protein
VGICRYTAGQKKKVGPLSLSSSTAARWRHGIRRLFEGGRLFESVRL